MLAGAEGKPRIQRDDHGPSVVIRPLAMRAHPQPTAESRRTEAIEPDSLPDLIGQARDDGQQIELLAHRGDQSRRLGLAGRVIGEQRRDLDPLPQGHGPGRRLPLRLVGPIDQGHGQGAGVVHQGLGDGRLVAAHRYGDLKPGHLDRSLRLRPGRVHEGPTGPHILSFFSR